MLFIFLVAFCLAASAAVLPSRSVCTFVLNAVGNANGIVAQDMMGENRIGGTYPQIEYYFYDGSLIDSQGHNCVIMADNYQFQCTSGSTGISNFSIENDGNLMQGDEEDWWACPITGFGADGSYNIFSYDLVDTIPCQAIALKTGGFNCTSPGPTPPGSTSAGSASATPTSAPTFSSIRIGIPALPTTGTASRSTRSTPSASLVSSTSASAISTAACPTDLSAGVFEYPHLIVPVSSAEPDQAFGTQFSAYISPVNSTLFSFDIPTTATYNDTCALIFLFPFGAVTYYSGEEEEEEENGGLQFTRLSDAATTNTTYNTVPSVDQDFGKFEVEPGHNYTITTFWCGAGSQITYEVSSKGNVELDYFQQSGANPMGLYIVPCDSTC